MTDVNATKATRRAGSPLRIWVLVAVSVVAVAAIGYAAWRHMVRPVDGRLEEVVGLLAANPAALPAPDVRHRVPLTGRFSGAAAHDEMFFTRRDDGSFMVLFPTFYGKGTSVECLLYTSRPLVPSDARLRQATLGKTEQVIDVPPYQAMKIDDRVDDHWYRVSYFMD